MAIKETIKAQAQEMTAPKAARPALSTPVRTKMGYSSDGRSDPMDEILEEDERNGGLTIDNSGRGRLRLRNPLFDISNTYDSVDGKEEERMENGGYTDLEMAHLGWEQDSYSPWEGEASYDDGYSYSCRAPVGYMEGDSAYGRDGKLYTAVLDEATGEVAYYDDGISCKMNPESSDLGSVTSERRVEELAAQGVAMNDDLIDDGQKFNINYKVDADGAVTERTQAEKDTQTALTRMDNQATKLPMQLDMIERITADVVRQPAANDPNFTSAAEPAIETTAKPSTAFNSAVAAESAPPAQTKSVVFRTDLAANNDLFLANGTTGTSTPAPAPKI